MKKILFVCTGNTCRSPMAEALFKKIAKQEDLSGFIVDSAGLAAFEGELASKNAVEVLKEIDIDITDHKSKSITNKMLQNTDVFICMTDSHKQTLLSAGVSCDKIIVLNIQDPFGCDIATYKVCRESIIKKLKELTNNKVF